MNVENSTIETLCFLRVIDDDSFTGYSELGLIVLLVSVAYCEYIAGTCSYVSWYHFYLVLLVIQAWQFSYQI